MTATSSGRAGDDLTQHATQLPVGLPTNCILSDLIVTEPISGRRMSPGQAESRYCAVESCLGPRTCESGARLGFLTFTT